MKAAILGTILLMAGAHSSPAHAQAPSDGLRPGDMVRITIWREPDLSGDYQVDEQGQAVFPKIGPLGEPPSESRAGYPPPRARGPGLDTILGALITAGAGRAVRLLGDRVPEFCDELDSHRPAE